MSGFWWDFYMNRGGRDQTEIPPSQESGGEEDPDDMRAMIGAWTRGHKVYFDRPAAPNVTCHSCERRVAAVRRTFINDRPLTVDICKMCA